MLRVGPAHRLPVTSTTGAVDMDDGGRILAATDSNGGWVFDLKKLDVEKSAASAVRLEHVNAQSVAASPNGQWVATGTQHGSGVKVWDARTGRLLIRDALIPHERVAIVTFSPDQQVACYWHGIGVWYLGNRLLAIGAADPPRASQ